VNKKTLVLDLDETLIHSTILKRKNSVPIRILSGDTRLPIVIINSFHGL